MYSAQITSVYKARLTLYESVSLGSGTEKCWLSVLTGIRIKRANIENVSNFRQEKLHAISRCPYYERVRIARFHIVFHFPFFPLSVQLCTVRKLEKLKNTPLFKNICSHSRFRFHDFAWPGQPCTLDVF